VPQEVGADFHQAVTLLRECGYGQVCRFSGRRRELVPLG